MKRIIGLLAVFVLTVLAFAQEPRVTWFDDFLGVKLNPAYALSLSETATIRLAPDTGGSGGVAMLSVVGYAPGVARLRLGEDPVTGGISALNFTARKNIVYQTRAFLNRNTDLTATIGFVGFADPKHVLAAVYDHTPGGPMENWIFNAAHNGKGLPVDTGFRHTPGKWFTLKIITEWGEVPKASMFINEALVAEIYGDFIPPSGLCPEFQIWNKPVDGAYSQPTMYIDYLSVSQDR